MTFNFQQLSTDVLVVGSGSAGAMAAIKAHMKDARTLVVGHGYELVSARVFDMFPHTHHIEALALFERS